MVINMKKKKLYKILIIFLLVLFCTMILLFIGCKENPEALMNREMANQVREQEEARAEEVEQIAREKQVKQDEAEERALDEAVDQAEWEEWEEAEEEENLIPNEPITYSTSIDGAKVILIVNFKTKEVKGSISKSGEDYVDATIKGEIININTFEITTNYSGIEGSPGVEFTINGTITGKITEDLNIFNGVITPDSYDEGVEFTATR
jgi:hypothetical protein